MSHKVQADKSEDNATERAVIVNMKKVMKKRNQAEVKIQKKKVTMKMTEEESEDGDTDEESKSENEDPE